MSHNTTDTISQIREHVDELGASYATWAGRDADKPSGSERQAANLAAATIDLLLAELHRVRSQLVTETRRADDATAVRVDALLAGHNSDTTTEGR